MKIYVALAALLTAAPSPHAGDYRHDETAIVLIYCQRQVGAVTGTAFKVSDTGYITAHHVVVGGTCRIAGQLVTITSLDAATDYATLTGPAGPARIEASCDGFTANQLYLARGFPGGGAYNIRAPWLATIMTYDGFRIFLSGEAIPGMSGGPVMDGRGRAVGLVNMRFPTRSMPLSSTGYCKA